MTTSSDKPASPRLSPVVQVGQRWEYYQETGCSTERLNTLGRAGWRLVGAPVVSVFTLGRSGALLYVFERPAKA